MNPGFEPAVIQYLIVIASSLVASTAVGLKRGWRGQLIAFVPILATWALLGSRKETLVTLINVAYRGLLFFSACGSQTDTATCVESSGIGAAALINPGDADQGRLLLLLVFTSVVVVVLALVMRFGRRPTSLLQRLVGALLGVANGFTLSYLLLPMLPYRQHITLPVASTAADEGLPSIAHGITTSFSVPPVSVAVVVLVVFVVFVILAVRLMRPTEV
jgi:hypothetical protein